MAKSASPTKVPAGLPKSCSILREFCIFFHKFLSSVLPNIPYKDIFQDKGSILFLGDSFL